VGCTNKRCERLSRPLCGTAVGLAPGGGLVGRPPDGTPAPMGPFPHGVGQTTPREALPTLGGRGHGGWLRSGGRLGWSSPRWNAGPPKRNGQRFRVGPFPHALATTMQLAAGCGVSCLGALPWGPGSDKYWEQWRTPHVFYCQGADDDLVGTRGGAPPPPCPMVLR
jgi:hypothetical protein